MSGTIRVLAVLSLLLLLPVQGSSDVAGDAAGDSDAVAGVSSEAAAEAAPEGEETKGARVGHQVFLDHNCALCHTAYSRGIGEPPEGWSEVGEGENGDVAQGGPPDLSSLGPTWTAELLTSYLVERVPLNGEKHVTAFRGSEEEWAALLDWMLASPAQPDSASVAETGGDDDSGRDAGQEKPDEHGGDAGGDGR